MKNAIKTNGGALIDPSIFKLSETAFVNAYPKEFKLTMFKNCNTIAECDRELRLLYAQYGQKKRKRQ